MVAQIDTGVGARSRFSGVSAQSVLNPYLASAFAALALWAILAGRMIPFLPSPLDVGTAFVEAVTSVEFYTDMAVSLRRVVLAAIGAWVVAVALGILMARFWQLDTIANPVIFVGLALPTPLVIFLSILAFGLGEITTMIALWVVLTPFVVTIMYSGALARDKRLRDMAKVYRFSRKREFRHVTLPELGPSLMSGARFAFAMGWKLVVLVEALSSNVGIGERLNYFFTFNFPERVIAWTLTFTVVMVLVELFVFRALERRIFDWRISRGLPGESVRPT